MADRHRAAVLGSPIAHSLSPVLHLAAYASLGLDWQYEAIDVDARAFPAFLGAMDDSWAGLSLTMPLKETAIRHLDVVDELAGQIKSVNTVLPVAEGWRGANTDVTGILHCLRALGVVDGAASATVLGAGATARSAIAALGVLGVRSVTVHARSEDAARDVAELATTLGVIGLYTEWQPDRLALEEPIVISTVPGEAGAEWSRFASSAEGALLDVSYHPWPSPLAGAWPTASIASGRDLLLWQAVEQVRLMTGLDPDPAAMAAALPA